MQRPTARSALLADADPVAETIDGDLELPVLQGAGEPGVVLAAPPAARPARWSSGKMSQPFSIRDIWCCSPPRERSSNQARSSSSMARLEAIARRAETKG